MADHEDKYQQIEDRKKYTNLILASQAKNKVVVAGAGTGKSFTFKSLISLKGSGDSLALTFINNLASDLANDLAGLSEVHTFHGYCKSILHKITVNGIDKHFSYFPNLPRIIQSDALILASHLRDLEAAIQKLYEGEEIDFYLGRANYYNAVGHNDSVYRVIKYFVANPGSIPKFSQIVVDEYQDFNPLEVEFIEQLAKVNPVLIAGDDDQAIYGFKNASPDHIRNKAKASDYELFELPYCSRCTQVVVTSVINITDKARELGSFAKRIPKKYICFLPEKESDSLTYPKIIHAVCSIQNKQDSRNYIGKYIESEISKIPQLEIKLAREKKYPCVLIIGPSQYLKQIYNYLKDRFPGIDYKEREDNEIEPLDGYRLLLQDGSSNLGWRIILEFAENELKEAVIRETNSTGTAIFELLDKEFIDQHLVITNILKKLINNEEINEKEADLIQTMLQATINDIKAALVRLDTEEVPKKEEDSLTIKLTTVNGSKGMSGGFVFIVGMNEGDLPRNPNNPTDQEICQLIVALTRTRKQCYLISNKRFGIKYGIRQSCLIEWIDSESITNLTVDANYFRNL